MSKTQANKKADHVPFGKFLAWQMRPISLGAVTIITMYLSIYCTDTLKMPAALVGTLLMASKIFDGVTDIIAGWLVDNTNTKLGKGRPYELSLIGVWVCMFLLFAGSDEWSMTAKAIWIFIMYTLVFSVFSTLLNAAETPYIIRAFGSNENVTKVASYGGLIVTFGSMIVSISFPIFMGTIATGVSGWRKLMLMYSVPLLVLGMTRFFFVKEDCVPENEETSEHISVKDIFAVLSSNKYVWFAAIACMVPQVVTSLSAASYYFTWIVGDISLYSAIQAISIVSLFFMLVVPALMKKFSLMKIIAGSAALGIVGYILLYFSGANLILIAVGSLLGGLVCLPTSYLKSPLVMEISSYNDLQGKPRMEGTMAAILNFLNKIGSALGSFILGIMLSMGGYDGSLEVQSDSAIQMIHILFGIVPAVLLVIVLISGILYLPLNKKLKEAMRG